MDNVSKFTGKSDLTLILHSNFNEFKRSVAKKFKSRDVPESDHFPEDMSCNLIFKICTNYLIGFAFNMKVKLNNCQKVSSKCINCFKRNQRLY